MTVSSCEPGRLPGIRHPQRQVLAGRGGREGAAVGRRQVDRRDGAGLVNNPADPQRPGIRPTPVRPVRTARCRGPARRRARPAGRFNQVPERLLPAGAQGGNPDGQAQLIRVLFRQVEQRVGVGHGQRVRARPGPDDLVAGLDAPFPDDPHVEAGAMVTDEQRRKPGFAEPQAHPVTGHPRLGDLELGLPDPVPVTDADLGVGQAVDGEVLAELAVAEVVPAEMLLPVPV